MAVEAGTFSKPTGGDGSTHDVTLDFTPTFVIVCSTRRTASGFGTDYALAYGFSDFTNEFSLCMVCSDGRENSTVNYQRMDDTKCLTMVEVQDGSRVWDCDATVSGKTITFTFGTNDANAVQISYLAGDASEVIVGSEAIAGSGNQSYTGYGDGGANGWKGMILLTNGSTGAPPQTFDDGGFAIGFATSSTDRASLRGTSVDAVSTTDTDVEIDVDNCLLYPDNKNATGTEDRTDFVSFDSDGFTLNHQNSEAKYFGFILINDFAFDVITDRSPSDTGVQTYSTSFADTVRGVLFAAKNATGIDSSNDHNRISLGAGSATDGSEEWCNWSGDTDNLATSEADQHHTAAKALTMTNTSSPTSTAAEADLAALDAGSFDLDWTTIFGAPFGTRMGFIAFAIGGDAAAAAAGSLPHRRITPAMRSMLAR